MKKKIIVLAPHTDDGELGCGASIAKFLDQENDVYYATFSLAEKSVPEGYPKNILESELRKAMHVLGIPRDNVRIFRYEVRKFSYHRQEILENLIELKHEISPDMILMPSLNDLHQDHQTIAEEGRRAFKQNTLLGYEMPWNNITFNTLSFIPVQDRHLKLKLDALKCYESQKYRNYLNEDFIKGLAISRGTQINTKFAEAFEVIRWIMD